MKASVCWIVWILFAIVAMTGKPLWAQDAIVTGLWGGEHIRLSASETQAAFELDCAHGQTDGPLVLSDPDGNFSLEGTLTLEHGGPVILGERPDIHPALYAGTVQEDVMHLMIILTDSEQEIGTFELVRDQEALLFRCL